MDVPYFSEPEVAKYLDYASLIELMEKAMIEASEGNVIQPVRQMLSVEENQRYLAIMPVAASDGMGAKLVAFYPKNANTQYHTHMGVIALFDTQTGQPLAFMDGRLITEMRTAANSAALTRYVAPENCKSLAIIGSGVQGRAHVAALSVLYDFEEITVWSRTERNARAFAASHNARYAATIEEAVKGADIIVTSTNSRVPLLKGEWLKPGCHVNSVGSPRHDWRELDDAVMTNTVIVDCRKSVLKEAGDIIHSNATIHAEAGEVMSGKVLVKRDDTTVFKSVGIAVQDIATARMVYERYKAKSRD